MKRGTIAAAFLLVGTLGCQRDRDRTMESLIERVIASKGRESKVTIDRQHDSITVDLGGATKPQGWPAAVPFYPRVSRAKIEAAAGNVQRVVLTTDDSVAAIGGFYSQELARLGWQVGGEEHGTWTARRGPERLELRVFGRDSATRAEIEYRSSGSS
jgi:hypothetical protein